MLLKWSQTVRGHADDYTGKDAAQPRAYCRVYRSASTSSGLPWFWTASDGHVDLGSGYAATAQEAAMAAETAYFAKRSERTERGNALN